MSVEKQARSALRRVTFWRILGELIEVPFDFLKAAAQFFGSIARIGHELTTSLFYLELHAAREYRLLTGVDLGVASGNPERYAGTTPEAFEKAMADVAEYDEDDD